MMHGNLANCVSYVIAFRCEDNLITFHDEGIGNKILNAFFGKMRRAEVSERFKRIMEYYYLHTEYTVDLVVERKNYTDEVKDYLSNLPFSRIILIDNEADVTGRLLTGDISYYIDDVEYRRGLVHHKYALSLNDFLGIFPSRRGR